MHRAPLLLGLALFVASACGPGGPERDGPGGAESGGDGPGPSRRAAPADADTLSASPAAPADSIPAVVFLGTSLSAGYGLAPTDSAFPALIGEMLDSAGYPHTVVDAGIPGETSAGGLRRVGRVLRRPVAVLVLELGANDGLRGHDPATLEANLQAIVDSTKARRPRARILLTGMEAPPNLGADYVDRFRKVFPEVARRNPGVRLLPFLLEGVAGVDSLNQADGIHPNARGHRRIARTLWPHLEPLLRVE